MCPSVLFRNRRRHEHAEPRRPRAIAAGLSEVYTCCRAGTPPRQHSHRRSRGRPSSTTTERYMGLTGAQSRRTVGANNNGRPPRSARPPPTLWPQAIDADDAANELANGRPRRRRAIMHSRRRVTRSLDISPTPGHARTR